jgi:hypothetical protein
MKRLDDDFLDEPLWSIHSVMRAGQTFLDDGQFNAVDGGYRFVVLKRQLSVDALKAQENVPPPEGASYVPENEAPIARTRSPQAPLRCSASRSTTS